MLQVTPLHPLFMARVEGLDLRQKLDAATCRKIEAAMDDYAVLVFPDQPLDDLQQVAFGQQFGVLEPEPSLVGEDRRRVGHAAMNDISNLDADGRILAADDRRRFNNLGNLLWHSDSSFKPTPAKYSMLHARTIPPSGGETEFADMRAAWDALPAAMQARLRDLVCEHSLIYSRGALGFTAFTPEELAKRVPVRQRLVRRHAGSGRLVLYLSSHIGGIDGWPRPEAMALIRELTEHATQRHFVYRHHWRQHDLVMWDNRCTMHRARPVPHGMKRDMHRTTVADTAPTLQQNR